MIVPNKFPVIESANRIALVGEAPGAEEVLLGEPFVGQSGKFLSALLSRSGISREACFIGNVCQHKPERNEIASFPWQSQEIQSGIHTLHNDLAEFKPNIVVCLGGAALHALRCHETIPKKAKQQGRFVYKWPYSPSLWRGSLFRASDYFSGVKAIGTYHPSYILSHDYDSSPLLQFDLKKAVQEAGSPVLKLPERVMITDLSPREIRVRLKLIRECKLPIAIDIEGGIGTMSCISFATGPDNAYIVPFFTKDLKPCFSIEDEASIWRVLAEVLEDASVPKILQNSLYDLFVLAYSYGIRVRGVSDDIMLKHWEHYCELEKALDLQTSIYTNQPYYKGDRKSQNDTAFYEYCCMDSCVTYEINTAIEPRLSGTRRDHYRFNMDFLDILLDMELRGIKYDTTGAIARRKDIQKKMYAEQAKLNGLVGVAHTRPLFDIARETLAKKKSFIERNDYQGILDNALKDRREDARLLLQLVKDPYPTVATLGHIEDILGLSLNTGSNKQMCEFLYSKLKMPVQYKRRKRGQVEEPPMTADYEALLKLAKVFIRSDDKVSYRILQHCIDIRALSTREGMLGIWADRDGRIRCGYNVVGSETGRIQCYTSPTGSGYNLQTIPKYDRDLFLADDNHWMFQCDLSGADGWTVACYSAMLGDRTMLDDYLYGLKPAKILVRALHGSTVDFNNRAELKADCKNIDSDSWDYFAMKSIQHGCSYCEGERTMSDSIFTKSEGKFYLDPAECRRLRDKFFFTRYPGIPRWHRWFETRIKERPTVIAASGSLRHFFGRREEILPKVVAHEAQHNTTYSTKLAAMRMWKDPENVDKRVIPLHMVHDSIVGQFRKQDTEWARVKIREWFNNELIIAGQKIVIPFEGTYGPSWGQQDEGTI